MKKIINFCKICLNHDEQDFNLSEKIRSKPSVFKNGLCQVCTFETKKKIKVNRILKKLNFIVSKRNNKITSNQIPSLYSKGFFNE